MSTQQIADLAWAGQHEQAIAAATAALQAQDARGRRAHDAARPARRELHRRRRPRSSPSADAQAMKALAKREGDAALQARALCRESFVQMRQGEMRAAVASATAALKAAREEPPAGARSAEPLGACRTRRALRRVDLDAAAAQCRARGRRCSRRWATPPGRAARCMCRAAHPLSSGSERDRAREAAAAALALARRCGDLFGRGQRAQLDRLRRGRSRHGAASLRPGARRLQGGGLCAEPGHGHRQPRRTATPISACSGARDA